MILTKDDIGKKFVTKEGCIVEGVACSSKYFVAIDIKLECFNVYTLEGASLDLDHAGNEFYHETIVKRYDERWWIKDLPSVAPYKLFGIKYIACDKDGEWWGYHEDPWRSLFLYSADFRDVGALSITKELMPVLKGDEWLLSKISIEELEEFEKENKK